MILSAKNLLLWLSIAALFAACAGPQNQAETTNTEPAVSEVSMEAWDAQIDAFHTLMAGTFHPAEGGNYAPLKEKAADMAVAAVTWNDLGIPASLQDNWLTEPLALLVKETAALSDQVAAEASDEDLNTAIFALHDRFHEIVGLCEDMGEHEHEGEEHSH